MARTTEPLVQDLATMGELIYARLLRRMSAGGESPEELTAPQRLTLRVLSGEPTLTITELADRTGVAPSTMTRMVQGLTRAGYVVESPARLGDRRRRLVAITPAGRSALQASTGHVHERIATLVSGLSGRERDELARGVRVLNGLLSADEARRRSG